MDQTSTSSGEYAFTHSEREHERLIAQAALFRPSMELVLREAGIGPGMRVLDAGCGAGDVSFLVAELVGPDGAVVGVDRSGDALTTARQRADALNLRHVTFLEGDIGTVAPVGEFDAVVGRQVLAYVADPVAVVRHLAGLVRPGGMVAFQEPDVVVRAWPPLPLYEQCWRWLLQAMDATGARVNMGLRLFKTFTDANLPPPRVRMDGIVGSGLDWVGYSWTAENIRTLLPTLERCGIATSVEVDIETLAERLRIEAEAGGGIVCPVIQCGAWTRTATE